MKLDIDERSRSAHGVRRGILGVPPPLGVDSTRKHARTPSPRLRPLPKRSSPETTSPKTEPFGLRVNAIYKMRRRHFEHPFEDVSDADFKTAHFGAAWSPSKSDHFYQGAMARFDQFLEDAKAGTVGSSVFPIKHQGQSGSEAQASSASSTVSHVVSTLLPKANVQVQAPLVASNDAAPGSKSASMWDRFFAAQQAQRLARGLKDTDDGVHNVDWNFQKVRWNGIRKRFIEITVESLKSQQEAKKALSMQDRILAKTKGSIGPEDKVAQVGSTALKPLLNETMADLQWPTCIGKVQARVGEAANNFDKRHKIAHAEALKQLNLLSGNSIRRCPAETTARSLDLRMEQLRGNRLTVQPLRFLSLSARDKPISPRELARNYNHSPRDKSQNHSLGGSFGGGPWVPPQPRLLGDDAPPKEQPTKKRYTWTLPPSIWGGRAKWCDARDFYDNDEVTFKRLSNDWKVALRLGVVKLIMQYDDDASVDEDGDGVPDEVDLLAGTMSDASVYTDRNTAIASRS